MRATSGHLDFPEASQGQTAISAHTRRMLCSPEPRAMISPRLSKVAATSRVSSGIRKSVILVVGKKCQTITICPWCGRRGLPGLPRPMTCCSIRGSQILTPRRAGTDASSLNNMARRKKFVADVPVHPNCCRKALPAQKQKGDRIKATPKRTDPHRAGVNYTSFNADTKPQINRVAPADTRRKLATRCRKTFQQRTPLRQHDSSQYVDQRMHAHWHAAERVLKEAND